MLGESMPDVVGILFSADRPYVVIGDGRDSIKDIVEGAWARTRHHRPDRAVEMLNQCLLQEAAVDKVADRPGLSRRRHGDGLKNVLLCAYVGQREGGPASTIKMLRKCVE